MTIEKEKKLILVEEMLKESEERYERIIEAITDYIYSVRIQDEHSIETIHSPACYAVTGYTKEELKNDPYLWIQMVYEDDRILVKEQAELLFAGEKVEPLEHRIIKKDGSLRWVRNTYVPYYDSHGKILSYDGQIQDITERKQVENALRVQKELLGNILSIVPHFIFWKNVKSVYLGCNKNFAEAAGVGEPVNIAGKTDYDLAWSKKEADYYRKCDKDVIEEGVPMLDLEESQHQADGKDAILLTSRVPLLDTKDNVIGILGSFVDITDHKKAEEEARKMQLQLMQAEKMASLGILVSGIAHEINNPNNFILLNTKIIDKIWKEFVPILDEHYKKNKDFIVSGMPYQEIKKEMKHVFLGLIEGANRIKNIVQNLKEFSQPDTGTWNQQIDVNLVVKSSVVIMNNLIKKSTDNFIVKYGDNLPKIIGSFQQLEQVLINLITNSCKALKSRKKIINIITFFDKEKNCIIIKIKDQGVGIPSENLDKIMDPFFTTKLDSGGTGLGLSISYAIIKKFNGEIKFISEVGKGTTVIVSLPILASDEDRRQKIEERRKHKEDRRRRG